MTKTPREECWPVWIWDESDYEHTAGYFGYVRYAEKDRLEQILSTLQAADFAFDYQVGLYMQEESDSRVPRPLTRFVERALEPYLDPGAPNNTPANRTDLIRALAPLGLRLAGRRIEG